MGMVEVTVDEDVAGAAAGMAIEISNHSSIEMAITNNAKADSSRDINPTTQVFIKNSQVPMSAAPNPVKRHNNWLYCWSHGYNVDHSSEGCTNPRPGHVWTATHNNNCGGCQEKKHKTMLPNMNNYM